MPSNSDLAKAIIEAAEAYAIEIPDTTGLNNEKLAALLSETKAIGAEEVALKLKNDATEKSALEKAENPTYYLAEGKALTTLRGIKSDGEEIKVSDLPGGLDAIEAFVKGGYIVKD
jgi:hypothetical protein